MNDPKNHECPGGYHWDEDTEECVKDEKSYDAGLGSGPWEDDGYWSQEEGDAW